MGCTLTFDFETRDPNIRLKKGAGWVYKDFDVLGVAYKLDANPSQFTTDMGTFRDIVGRSQIIIAHNAQYDVGCLNRLDIPYADKTIIDTTILAKLYDNTIQSYSLDSLSTSFFGENKDYASLLSAYAALKTEEHTEILASKPGNRIFDVEGKRYLAIKVPAMASLEDVRLGFQRAQQNPKDKSVPFTSVFDLDGLLSQYKDTVLRKTSTSNAMSHIADIFKRFPDIVAKYAKKDVDLTYQLYMFFKENLYDEGLALIDFYSDLIKALVKWRRKGVKLDMDQVALSREALQLCEKEAIDHFRKVAGVETCNFNSTAEMAEIFTRLGIQVGTSKTGEPSVCKEWRELQTHPMVACFSDIKTYSKLRRDFIDGLATKMENGRIYPEINILGADETGRFSSTNPNIQQIPKRSPNAKSLIRGIFSSEPGEHWYSLDFSSQEPRLQVHYAFLAGCSGADVLRDAFHKNPTYDLHQKVADMASIDRKTAKTINLGISYGMGVARLASSLKIDKAEASALRKQYNKASPYLHQLNNAVKKSGLSKGYIRTVLGRRLRMDYDLPYKSLNKLIQGSAADQTAMAMVMAYREGLDISFSVHDELNFSSKSPKDALRLKEIMETCIALSVPSYTEIMTGPSWGSLTPL